jgi:hypothetical protein
MDTDLVKSTIYKICCKNAEITDCYVGRSIDIITRLQTHKSCCNIEKGKSYNYKLYQKIRDNGGFENWSLEEIETIEHDSDDTTPAREREFFWFSELKANLNNNTPNQSHKESVKIWQANNKGYSKIYVKKYREENKDKIKEKNQKYYDKNKEKMKETSKIWINKEDNREKNRTYQRERCRKIAELKRLQKLSVISLNHCEEP